MRRRPVLAFTLLLAAFACLMQPACRSPRRTPPSDLTGQVLQVAPPLDSALQVDLMEREVGGTLEVEALLRNVSEAEVKFLVTLVFLDAAGRELAGAGEPVRMNVTLAPGKDHLVRETCADGRARRFKLTITPP
ncbi:MAG: hypothetical protein RDV41_03955 [Planctomycetota bacterium]|nr:hypothetical protein [Planctomycetota bacterium]